MKNYLPIIIVVVVLIVIGYFAFNQPTEEVQDNSQTSVNKSPQESPKPKTAPKFYGEKGEAATIEGGAVQLEESSFNGNTANYYNVELSDGAVVYFFVLRDKQGTFRAAANACQICFDDRKGFRQQGDYMVCNTCGNKYPLAKIATEKGGCNPGPINPNLEVKDGKVIIDETDLQEVEFFFN